MDVSMRTIPIEETRFFKDLYGTLDAQGQPTGDAPIVSVNGNDMPRGYYNLIVITTQVDGYVRLGLKPHGSWKFKNIKEYFGIKGKGENVLQYLKDLKTFLTTE